MSRDGSVTYFWGDGEHRFRLPIGHLRELQEKTDCGPYRIFDRLRTGDWRVDDVRETIRLGLIGGGMKPFDAHRLVVRYFDEYGLALLDHIPAALQILTAALLGPQDEPLGKKAPAKAKRKPTRKEGSPLPGSTAPAQ
jgi:hypothetical protein